MIKRVREVAEEFLRITKNKKVRIISHNDTGGITSASILAKTLQRLDKKFSLKIVKALTKEIIEEETKRQPEEILIFTDLGSNSIEHLQENKHPLFILDHHHITKEQIPKNVHILNPHLIENTEENFCTGAGIAYLFSKAISTDNQDLANLAVIGLIGDRQDTNPTTITKEIIEDAEDLQIKKGLLLYPATRPLQRALEYSTSLYLPGITGNGPGVIKLLKETNINPKKSLVDLTQEEMSRLITAVVMRRTKRKNETEIIGNLYTLKFFTTKEDVRELSVLINACSKLGKSDIAIAYCLGDPKAKMRALDIYTQYKHEIVNGLKTAEKINKIGGKGFVIMNAKDKIKDAIVGTVCSMLSNSPMYDEGTIVIGLAYNQDKIKLSARLAGTKGRNIKELLDKTINIFKTKHPETIIEFGGHHHAAGAIIEKNKEEEFIQTLKENLEIEIIKI